MEVGEEFQGMKLAGELLHNHTLLDPRKLVGLTTIVWTGCAQMILLKDTKQKSLNKQTKKFISTPMFLHSEQPDLKKQTP